MSILRPKRPEKSKAITEMEMECKCIDMLRMMQNTAQGKSGFAKYFKELGYADMLNKRLKKGGDVKISLLLALSKHTGRNLLDYYIQILPENCRQTCQTYALEREKTELQKQLQTKQQESDAWQERCLRAEKLIEERMRG